MSSAYNFHGKATLNSMDKASMTITNSKGLNVEPLPQNRYHYHRDYPGKEYVNWYY